MQQTNHNFANAPAYDGDGQLVIRSTCDECGEFRLVNVRDGSLKRWESKHECSGSPKIHLVCSKAPSGR